MDIPNPPETERIWLNALEEENQKGFANLRAMTEKSVALTPEEIVAVLNYLHALDQYYSRYVPTADALSALGHPSLSQRLVQVRQDMHQSIAIYGDMSRSAVDFRSHWDQMQRETATAVTQSIWQTTMHTQSVFDQMNRLQALINEGVPYYEALLLSRLPS
jgi:5'-deoxynucleotidase YfbR-like HD superfamily hydrolase